MPCFHRDVIFKGFWLGWVKLSCSYFLRIDSTWGILLPSYWVPTKKTQENLK